MSFEVAFVIALSFLGHDFVRMTFCSYCGEKYLRNEPTDLFHPHKLWDQKYGENVSPYYENEDSLVVLLSQRMTVTMMIIQCIAT